MRASTTTAHSYAEVLELKKSISRNLSELCQFQRALMPGLTPIFNKIHNNETIEDSLKL